MKERLSEYLSSHAACSGHICRVCGKCSSSCTAGSMCAGVGEKPWGAWPPPTLCPPFSSAGFCAGRFCRSSHVRTLPPKPVVMFLSPVLLLCKSSCFDLERAFDAYDASNVSATLVQLLHQVVSFPLFLCTWDSIANQMLTACCVVDLLLMSSWKLDSDRSFYIIQQVTPVLDVESRRRCQAYY